MLVPIFVQYVAVMCGPASIVALTGGFNEGQHLLNDKIIGTPSQQYIVVGGLHSVTNNKVIITVYPLFRSCLLRVGTIIARGLKVQLINSIALSRTPKEPTVLNENEIKINETIDTDYKRRLLEILHSFSHCCYKS